MITFIWENKSAGITRKSFKKEVEGAIKWSPNKNINLFVWEGSKLEILPGFSEYIVLYIHRCTHGKIFKDKESCKYIFKNIHCSICYW